MSEIHQSPIISLTLLAALMTLIIALLSPEHQQTEKSRSQSNGAVKNAIHSRICNESKQHAYRCI